MEITRHSNISEFEKFGTKAYNLALMKSKGINVPQFMCIKSGFDDKEMTAMMNTSFCRGEESFAVRSSADCEDGGRNSYAGQFRTFLGVKRAEVPRKVEECLSFNGGRAYAKASGTVMLGKINCIVQEMIFPELSGVIFTSNPCGRLNETVIALGRGLGENVVSGKGEVTHYYVNRSDGSVWYETQGDSPLADSGLIDRLLEVSDRIKKIFGFPCDIEFAVRDGVVFILQARKITALDTENTVTLDNSNICESYPGVSLPLTQDFAQRVYYGVFKSVVYRLTKSRRVTKQLDGRLRKMTDCADGRIYYRISNWYDVLELLPFSGKIIPLWQEMLGVENKDHDTDFHGGALIKLSVTVQFFRLIFTNNREMKKLKKFFARKINVYRQKVSDTESVEELLSLYRKICTEICSVWDITLVNDMYSFIFTGLLKKLLKLRYPENYEEALNLSIHAGGQLESMKPVNALAKLKDCAEKAGYSKALSEISTADEYENFRSKCSPKFGAMLDKYTELYGDRAPGELKLESKTPRTNPEMLPEMILSAAEPAKAEAVKYRLTAFENALRRRACQGVRQRERSRLDRSRLFGLMREIILKCGQRLCSQGCLEAPRDIFYLSIDEISLCGRGKNFSREIRRRKELYRLYSLMPSPQRIVFSGEVKSCVPANINSVKCEHTAGLWNGTACSPGVVTGQVVKVVDPRTAGSVKGKIVLARSTDPGWVTVISQSAGLISEKGSLLSHTAIISRELKKPAVVGAAGIFDDIPDGAFVRLDGTAGTVELTSDAQ